MFPVAISMAFELATYGLVSGLLRHRAKHNLPALYAVLLAAMVSGRIVWGIVRFVLAGLTGGSFPFSALFVRGAVYRRAGHRGAAGAHPAAAHRPAKGQALRTDPLHAPFVQKNDTSTGFLRHVFSKRNGKPEKLCRFVAFCWQM